MWEVVPRRSPEGIMLFVGVIPSSLSNDRSVHMN